MGCFCWLTISPTLFVSSAASDENTAFNVYFKLLLSCLFVVSSLLPDVCIPGNIFFFNCYKVQLFLIKFAALEASSFVGKFGALVTVEYDVA